MNERNKEKQKELKRETQNKRNNKEPEEGTPAHKSALKTQYVFRYQHIPTTTSD